MRLGTRGLPVFRRGWLAVVAAPAARPAATDGAPRPGDCAGPRYNARNPTGKDQG